MSPRVALAAALSVVAAVAARAEVPSSPRDLSAVARPFVAVGAFVLDRSAAFDRQTPGSGRGPGLFAQVGVDVRVSPEWSVAGLFARASDANRDGADVDFAIGEVRVRLPDMLGGWLAIGGGRVSGAGRKSSFVETVAFGRDLGPRTYAELRAITDEGDGNLASLSVGWRF